MKDLAALTRYYVLTSTSRAKAGHPTSCLSAVELTVSLLFGGTFRAHLADPQYPTNDQLIFSKGHAAPLLYSLYAVAGVIPARDLATLRQFGSALEGHPVPTWPYVKVATGSLGQGLSVGVGMALAPQPGQKIYVLLGDSEFAEGSNLEAMQLAAHAKLENLVGILDVNRLGQRGPTMWEHDLARYQDLVEALGWRAVVVEDGHDLAQLERAWATVAQTDGRPTMLIAQTIKGKGVSWLEDAAGWHGKVLSTEELERALTELGPVDSSLVGQVTAPEDFTGHPEPTYRHATLPAYETGSQVAVRRAVGESLQAIAGVNPEVVVLDAEVANSTFTDLVAKAEPKQFIETYIAEQNMIGVAMGLAAAGKTPVAATFAAFLTRAFDQLRMAALSNLNLKVIGTHVGISIGSDGPSQMGLQDIAQFRSLNATVLYPADATAAAALTEKLLEHNGLGYLRATRADVPVIYDDQAEFRVGGSHVLRHAADDVVTLVTAGITVFEALKAADRLTEGGIRVRVIDAYSVHPLDQETLRRAYAETKALWVIEDHVAAGGLGEAVLSLLATETGGPIFHRAVTVRPQSGEPAELLAYAGLDAAHLIEAVTQYLTHAH